MKLPIKSALEIFLQIIIHNMSNCITTIIEKHIPLTVPGNTSFFAFSNLNISNLVQAKNMACSNYIIQLEDPEKFMEIHKKVNLVSLARTHDSKFVFIGEDDDKMLKIFDNDEIKHTPNIIVVIRNKGTEPEEFKLLKHKFETNNEILSITEDITAIDVWNARDGFKTGAIWFPNKIKDLMGKVVKVASYEYKPFVTFDVEDNGDGGPKWDGIESRVMDEFCRKMNCTIQIVDEPKYKVGTIFSNGTGNGVLADVAYGGSDFGIGSQGSWHETFNVVSSSGYILLSTVTCLVPKPRPVSRWSIPFLALSGPVWAALWCSMVVAAAALAVARRSVRNVGLVTFGIMLEQSQATPPRSRRIVSWLIVSGWIVNSAYCSGLASLLTVARHGRGIQTEVDLARSGLLWAGTHPAWIYTIKNTQNPQTQQLIRQFRALSEQELKEYSLNRSIAFGVQKLYVAYVIGSWMSPESASHYQLMSEPLYHGYGVVTCRKNSPYIEELNILIGRLKDTGLVLAWDGQVTRKYLNYKVQQAITHSKMRPPPHQMAINMDHVSGIFYIYAVCTLIYTVCFLIEYIYGKRKLGLPITVI